MELPDAEFTLEPHHSGKATCFVANFSTGERFFAKFPRTSENEVQGIEEIFNELLGGKIFSTLGIYDIKYDVKPLNLRLAIIQRYHPKDWSNAEDEGVEVVNLDEWPLFLAAESWMRQSDRLLDKKEHVGLALVDGEPGRYRAIPLDLGHALIGHPGGYTGVDEDLTSEWMKNLFWTNKDIKKDALISAISLIEKVPVYQVIYEIVQDVLKISNWSETIKLHLKKHADNVAHFLLVRRVKLKEVLLAWWEEKYKDLNTISNSEQVAIA